eukprot:5470639-Amphidinium_carterae.1
MEPQALEGRSAIRTLPSAAATPFPLTSAQPEHPTPNSRTLPGLKLQELAFFCKLRQHLFHFRLRRLQAALLLGRWSLRAARAAQKKEKNGCEEANKKAQQDERDLGVPDSLQTV